MPAWPGRHDRPRVLVEAQGATWIGSRALQAGGFQVVSCPGPLAIGCGCPALEGEPCPLVTAADAVVVGLPAGTEVARSLLEAHRLLHPEVPMCALGSGDQGEAATALPHPPVGSDGPALVDFLQELIAGGRREDGPGSDPPGSQPESDLGPYRAAWPISTVRSRSARDTGGSGCAAKPFKTTRRGSGLRPT